MKNFILFILVLAFAAVPTQAKKIFVKMEFSSNKIYLDDGSSRKAQALKGDGGKELKFLSLAGALNYMSLQGWELVTTVNTTSGTANFGPGTIFTTVSYIFSKEIPDDELQKVVEKSYKKE